MKAPLALWRHHMFICCDECLSTSLNTTLATQQPIWYLTRRYRIVVACIAFYCACSTLQFVWYDHLIIDATFGGANLSGLSFHFICAINWNEQKKWRENLFTKSNFECIRAIEIDILVSVIVQRIQFLHMCFLASNIIFFKKKKNTNHPSCSGGWSRCSWLVWSVLFERMTFMRWKRICAVTCLRKNLQNYGNPNAKSGIQACFASYFKCTCANCFWLAFYFQLVWHLQSKS